MGVSKNSGTPKWMVFNGKPHEQMDDFGGKHTIFGNIHIGKYTYTQFYSDYFISHDPRGAKDF